jgi:hypothetical protein
MNKSVVITDREVQQAKGELMLVAYRMLQSLQIYNVLDAAKRKVPCHAGVMMSTEEAVDTISKYLPLQGEC